MEERAVSPDAIIVTTVTSDIDALLRRHPSLDQMHQAACDAALLHGKAIQAEEAASEAYNTAYRTFANAHAQIERMEAEDARDLTDHERRVHRAFAEHRTTS
jgi:hypothetical protein